jgi:hypothetical protein
MILMSALNIITHCQTPEMGEAIACQEGLKLALANCTALI